MTVNNNFRPDPELEGKLLSLPVGTYNKARSILNMLRSDGKIQNPDNYMNMVINYGIGPLLDWLFEFTDKVTQRQTLYGLINIDDCKYGYNCPETLSELISKGNNYELKVNTDKIVTFYEYYNDEVVESATVDLKILNNPTILTNTIKELEIINVDDEYYFYIHFMPKLVKNPNYDGEPEGYDADGNAYEYIDLANYPDDFVPDGYDGEGKPYLIIDNFEPEYNEILVDPIYYPVKIIDEYYTSFPDNYPFEILKNEDGTCVIDEEAYIITTKTLEKYGEEYGIPRLPGESNQDYARRMSVYTQDVSSICGFRKYVCELLDLTDDDIKTEFIFTRLKVFETTLRDNETDLKKSSFVINRISSDNVKGQEDKEADVTVARDAGEVTNQLVLKLTIPNGFDLKWCYEQLIDLLPIGLLLEVWDTAGNYYPSIFNIDLLMCTNLHLLKNHSFFLNNEEKVIDENSKYISLDNDGDFFEFNVPGYHVPDTNLDTSDTAHFRYYEYISRDIDGVMMVNPKESFILQLLIKIFKKNEFMFCDI